MPVLPSPASEAVAHARWAALRRGLWLLPLLASLLFVIGVLAWAYRADLAEREDRRTTLIADALSSEAQLQGMLGAEMAHVQDLARQLPRRARSAEGLLASPDVSEGLRRLWLSVTWLDDKNRILAHVPDQNALAGLLPGELADGPGLSAHLTQAMGVESLVVRYSPTLLLRRGIPWWLAHKYDMQLIDSSEQVIASLDQTPLRTDSPGRESYMVSVGGNMPGAFLELSRHLSGAPCRWC